MTSYELSPCPICGGGRETTIATRDQVEREMEELWAFHSRRLRPGTPVERLADRVVFSQHPPLRVGRCGECGLVFRNPREEARELVEGYAGEEQSRESLESLFRTQRESYRAQARRLTRLVGSARRGLEVGSYVGAFLAAAGDLGWDFEGVDVNAATTAFACSQGLRARTGTLDDLRPPTSFDAIAIWNTFEQLPDPRAAAIAARELLVPGGLLALRVPNGAFYAALSPLVGGPAGGAARALLAHNNLLGFPYRHGFTPSSARRLLGGLGFEVVLTVGDALVPIADEWTRKWAATEERVLKTAIRFLSPVLPTPWFEVYARRPA